MQAPKNGFFYVLDRATGELLSAAPYVPVTWAERVDLASGRPVETPAARYGSQQPAVLSPGPVGGQDREKPPVIRILVHSEEGHEPRSVAQCVAHTCREIV